MTFSVDSSGGGQCPVNDADRHKGLSVPECPAAADPTNNMLPSHILQTDLDAQSESLSSERTTSSIPRTNPKDFDPVANAVSNSVDGGTDAQKWTYPSPKMFYNALLRKGKPVGPEDIEPMLHIHNTLNEQVWQRICALNRKLGAEEARGEGASWALTRFRGRPGDLSPKAWWHVWVRGGVAPFDRHDWILEKRVLRDDRTNDDTASTSSASLDDHRSARQQRWVIDYYDSGEEGSFMVDCRPAIDDFSSLIDRVKIWYNKW